MALGSVSSLGVGSGFELQQMLDDLRAVDEATINIKEAEKTRLTAQIIDFDSLSTKIFKMKESALALSLESNFMERSAVLDEEVATVTVMPGSASSSHSLEIERLASKSSFQATTGVETSTSVMYSEPTTTLTSFSDPAVLVDTTLSFTVEHENGQQNISLNLAANSSIDDIVDAINTNSTAV